MIKLLGLAALVGVGWVAYDSRDDIRRYLRIRAMQAVHEFGVAAAVLDAVEARAAGRDVRAVRLQVGALQRLDRDVFDAAFAMVADGGVAAGAALDVVEVAVRVRCRGCAATTTGDELVVACGTCGAHDLDLLSGDDLVLESITLTDTRTEQEVGQMCLGIPGELVELPHDDTDLALVTVSGVRRKVNVGLLAGEEALAVGDWILIHVGFALAKIDEEEAASALRVLRQLGPAYDQELQDFATTDVG